MSFMLRSLLRQQGALRRCAIRNPTTTTANTIRPSIRPSIIRTYATRKSDSDPIIPTDQTAEPLSNAEAREAAEAQDGRTPEEVQSDLIARIRAAEAGEEFKKASPKQPETGKGGARKKEEHVTSQMKRRERNASIMFFLASLGLVGQIVYLGRNWDDEEEAKRHADIPDGLSIGLFYARAKARINDFVNYFQEPAFDKLLPDPIPDPAYQRPYTLVLSLEDLLVHTEWDSKKGWRMAKRPGLDYFLGYLFQYYELVVFTDLPAATAMPMVQKINEYPGYIMHALFRDSCLYEKGKYIKDLNYLNRDLSKVVMINTKPENWAHNPNNTIKLPPWKGDPKDKTLIALIPFLEYIAGMGIQDVRPVIEGFGDKDIPTEFARREAIAREEWKKQVAEKKKAAKSTAGGLFTNILGVKPHHSPEEEEMTLFDLQRKRGIEAYLETQKHLTENKEALLKEQEEQEKAMNEAYRTSLGKILTEGLPKPPSQ